MNPRKLALPVVIVLLLLLENNRSFLLGFTPGVAHAANANIAGKWNYLESSGTVTCTINAAGDSETNSMPVGGGSGLLTIIQNGSNISLSVSRNGQTYSVTGTIVGNQITIGGRFGIIPVFGFITLSSDNFTAQGTVSADGSTINLTGFDFATGSGNSEGIDFTYSCSTSIALTFSRPRVGFAAASSSGSESVTAVNLPVTLSSSVSWPVTVQYSVTGGTATGGGVDYTLPSGTLTFTAGQTTKNIPLTVVNDSLPEQPNQTIQVTLSVAADAALGTNPVHTHTIIDNDFCLHRPPIDFDGDCKSDILWRHTSGAVNIWLVDGPSYIVAIAPDGLSTEWTIAGVGDFNGDGHADILWRHTSGNAVVWLFNGTTVIGAGSLGTASTDWTIAGVGDFNGDGKSDILWRHTSGNVYLWLLDGTSWIGAGSLGIVSTDWTIAGVGDFNGDGKSDILWRHTSGNVYLWLLDGTSWIGAGSLGIVSTDWTIAGVGDFNGDGKSDILWRHTSGNVYIWMVDGPSWTGAGSPGSFSTDWTIAGVGDFNGDGKSDILWRHTSGDTYVWLLNGASVIGAGSLGTVSTDWQIQ